MTSGGKTFETGKRPTRAMQKIGPRQCKKRWNQPQKTQRPNKCFFCDESGHFVRDCPKAKALCQKAELEMATDFLNAVCVRPWFVLMLPGSSVCFRAFFGGWRVRMSVIRTAEISKIGKIGAKIRASIC